MIAGYGLGPERDQKIEDALKSFRSDMRAGDMKSFIDALEKNNIEVSMVHDLGKIYPDLVAFIEFSKNIDKKKSTIYIDKDIDNYDLFFYLAHEVGHHMMHYNSGREIPQFRSREKNYSTEYKQLPEEEQEADVFAYNLLMPDDDFRRIYGIVNRAHEGDKDKIITDLTEYFFVGKEFVLKRIEYLGLM